MINHPIIKQYHALCESNQIVFDNGQYQVLEKLAQWLIFFTPRKFSWLRKKKKNQKGMYLWGGVGSGKTFLFTLFFEAIPFSQKLRIHFHEFMVFVHKRLHELHQNQDPLKILSQEIAQQYQIIFFDEFFVSEIGDAMILARLLTYLFQKGMFIFLTSNVAPENLYLKGFHRERFLPCIHLLQTVLEVICLESHTDYRFRKTKNVLFSPTALSNEVSIKFITFFEALTSQTFPEVKQKLLINHRDLIVEAVEQSYLWVHFNDLCSPPRHAADYLMLSKKFKVFLISGVPTFSDLPESQNGLLLFTYLIDILYDNHGLCFIDTPIPISNLYTGNKIVYQRAFSRLNQMQSDDYIKQFEESEKIFFHLFQGEHYARS